MNRALELCDYMDCDLPSAVRIPLKQSSEASVVDLVAQWDSVTAGDHLVAIQNLLGHVAALHIRCESLQRQLDTLAGR